MDSKERLEENCCSPIPHPPPFPRRQGDLGGAFLQCFRGKLRVYFKTKDPLWFALPENVRTSLRLVLTFYDQIQQTNKHGHPYDHHIY